MKKNTLLIVYDREIDIAILNEILTEDFLIVSVRDPDKALTYLKEHAGEILAMLADIKFAQEKNDYYLLKMAHQIERTSPIRVPLILITADSHESIMHEGLRLGISDYLVKPFNPTPVRSCIRNVVKRTWGKTPEKLAEMSELEEERFIRQMQSSVQAEEANQEAVASAEASAAALAAEKERAAAASEQSQSRTSEEGPVSLEEAERLFLHWQRIMSHMYKTRHLQYHIPYDLLQVASTLLCDAYISRHPQCKLTEYDSKLIGMASVCADIGQLYLPDAIQKAGPSQPEPGRSEYQLHPEHGRNFFRGLPPSYEPFSIYCRQIAAYHAERHDGLGYPDGLEGNSIPLSAQIANGAMLLIRLIKKHRDAENLRQKLIDGLKAEAGHSISFEMFSAFYASAPSFDKLAALYKSRMAE